MSIRVLAKQLDLSITTVSRALAGYSDVSAQTRDRVRDAAKVMGYRPNASARNLKLGRANAIGMVMPAARPGGDPFLAELIGGVGAALAGRDLDLVVSATPEGEGELAAIQRIADGRKVDGFILPRTRWDDPRVDLLLDMGMPFVTHGRTSRAAEHAWLDIDGEAAFQEATERLLGLGHRRIALVNAPRAFTFARHREAGFRAAMAAAGMAEAVVTVAEAARVTEGEAAATAALTGSAPPTALLCATDQIAIGALAAIRKRGLVAGSDVSVIGYDDLAFVAHIDPPLTTMRQSIADEGRALVDLLLGRIGGKPVTELQVLWRAHLVARSSDGPPREARGT